jgi:hypothetical protein
VPVSATSPCASTLFRASISLVSSGSLIAVSIDTAGSLCKLGGRQRDGRGTERQRLAPVVFPHRSDATLMRALNVTTLRT